MIEESPTNPDRYAPKQAELTALIEIARNAKKKTISVEIPLELVDAILQLAHLLEETSQGK